MIFELSQDNLKEALKEYMANREILVNREFTFQVKTSRKGLKTSRTIIEVIDSKPSVTPEEPVVEAAEEPQMELPLEPMLEVARTKPFMKLV